MEPTTVAISFVEAAAALRSQPFSALLGTELTEFADGRVELTLENRPNLSQQHGFVHGGVLSYLADNAVTFAGGGVLGPAVVTGAMTIDYVRPAQGPTLVARARTVYAGARHAVVQAEVLVRDETGAEIVCALAQGTVRAMPPR